MSDSELSDNFNVIGTVFWVNKVIWALTEFISNSTPSTTLPLASTGSNFILCEKSLSFPFTSIVPTTLFTSLTKLRGPNTLTLSILSSSRILSILFFPLPVISTFIFFLH